MRKKFKIKNKNGFTLIELLAVLILLSLTIIVGFNAIMKTIESSKEKAFQDQVNRIIKLSKTCAFDNLDKLTEINESIYIVIKDLQ